MSVLVLISELVIVTLHVHMFKLSTFALSISVLENLQVVQVKCGESMVELRAQGMWLSVAAGLPVQSLRELVHEAAY